MEQHGDIDKDRVRLGDRLGETRLTALGGISDGKTELDHIDDWTEYLHGIDEKLAAAVDRLGAALAKGRLNL